ncbi:Epoxide hydrolase domain protein [Terriglobus saanensis SP1PR4]|uniref:Epoxide hydrolase domain protein n=2 Tax=Terriglobus saanensis TaxID=870903 RepID=E8V0K2_TERSS|nr:Epoxide hydrolase domain protein [Terriglobus saanensis SP1PR4]
MRQDYLADEVTVGTQARSRRMRLQAALGAWALGFGPAEIAAQGPILSSVGADLPPVNDAVSAFRVAIPSDAIEDLRRRLAMTRWPERETVADGAQGVPLARAGPYRGRFGLY